MQMAQLAPETVAKLREFVPAFGSLGNPVDVTAAIFNDLSLINRTLQAINDDPGVDCIAMINASLQGEIAQKVASEIVAVAAKTTSRYSSPGARGMPSRRRLCRARCGAYSPLQIAGAVRAGAGRGVLVCRSDTPQCGAARRPAAGDQPSGGAVPARGQNR